MDDRDSASMLADAIVRPANAPVQATDGRAERNRVDVLNTDDLSSIIN